MVPANAATHNVGWCVNHYPNGQKLPYFQACGRYATTGSDAGHAAGKDKIQLNQQLA